MTPIDLPPAFTRFRDIAGALQFWAFDDAGPSASEASEAIARSFATWSVVPPFDGERLLALGGRRIDRATFFGDGLDQTTRDLIRGLERAIEPPIGEPGEGGQFVRAFAYPPYGLRAEPSEIQRLFDEVVRFVLPPEEACEITDWAHDELDQVSPYFDLGMEWWGVFLFTIWQPTRGRLVVIVGSGTD